MEQVGGWVREGKDRCRSAVCVVCIYMYVLYVLEDINGTLFCPSLSLIPIYPLSHVIVTSLLSSFLAYIIYTAGKNGCHQLGGAASSSCLETFTRVPHLAASREVLQATCGSTCSVFLLGQEHQHH